MPVSPRTYDELGVRSAPTPSAPATPRTAARRRTRPARRLLLGIGVAVALLATTELVPAAPVPGYRPLAVWPASTHGLPAPSALAADSQGRLWLLDAAAGEVVALASDGGVIERRSVPDDSLDLDVGDDGHLYLGRWDPQPPRGETQKKVTRLAPDGSVVWTRQCDCATGSGVAWTPGRVWLTDAEAGGLRWLGDRDGRVTGELDERQASSGFPADVDAAADGRLFGTDLVAGKVWHWGAPYLPNRADSWTMLERAGPFRVGAGTQSDGDIVVAVLFSDGLVRAQRPDGTLLARFAVGGEPGDIAVGQEGRIYLLDTISGQIHVWAPGPPPTPTPAPPDPPRVRGSCTVRGTRQVAPQTIARCERATVTLRVEADCPPDAIAGADVALVIDRSLSMTTGNRMREARGAARRFLAGLDPRFHQAAIVSFSTDAIVEHPLTAQLGDLGPVVDGLSPEGSGTNIADALRFAMRHLEDRGRPDALPVLIVLTDGVPNRPKAPEATTAALAAAERARARRAYIVTVGLGRFVDSLLLETIASTPGDFYYSPSALDLERIYDAILDVVRAIGISDLTIRDMPRAPALSPVRGSAVPQALVVGGAQQWSRPVLPVEGLVLSHTIRAHQPGGTDIGEAIVRYVDADGTRRSWRFPEPRLEVLAPPDPGGTGAPPATPTLPPAPPRQGCDLADGWRLNLSVYPDVTGFGPYPCPGCSGRFRSADHWARGAWRETGVVLVRAGDGTLLWRGDVGAKPTGPGYVSVLLCQPPPYTIELARMPQGYVSCPNSPAVRHVDAGDFLRGYHGLGFALWRGCGQPTPTPPAALPPCP